jgi:hypothetical protein
MRGVAQDNFDCPVREEDELIWEAALKRPKFELASTMTGLRSTATARTRRAIRLIFFSLFPMTRPQLVLKMLKKYLNLILKSTHLFPNNGGRTSIKASKQKSHLEGIWKKLK